MNKKSSKIGVEIWNLQFWEIFGVFAQTPIPLFLKFRDECLYSKLNWRFAPIPINSHVFGITLEVTLD